MVLMMLLIVCLSPSPCDAEELETPPPPPLSLSSSRHKAAAADPDGDDSNSNSNNNVGGDGDGPPSSWPGSPATTTARGTATTVERLLPRLEGGARDVDDDFSSAQIGYDDTNNSSSFIDDDLYQPAKVTRIGQDETGTGATKFFGSLSDPKGTVWCQYRPTVWRTLSLFCLQ